MSVPFEGQEFNFVQPDGTTVKVRMYGNNRRAAYTSLDGYALAVDPQTGFLTYVEAVAVGEAPRLSGIRAGGPPPVNIESLESVGPDAADLPTHLHMRSGLDAPSRWEIRRERLRRAVLESVHAPPDLRPAPPSRRTVGTFFGLCVPVQFPDVPATISRDEIEAFCNKPGYSGFGNNGSVRDYYLDVSSGKVDYSNIVIPYFTTKHPRSYYTDPKVAQPLRAQELIYEVLNHLKSQGFDASKLTVDPDNYVYALNVFYAGGRVNNWGEGLWPHQYTLRPPFNLGAGRVMADYQITDIGTELTLGTFCHENGHMLCDFPDLYDYAQDKVRGGGVGAYCLMCAGGTINPKNPTDINAYLKFKAGWAEVAELTDGTELKAHAGTNRFFLRARNPYEYFLVENRQKTGRDASLPAAGLAIWHVDELGDNEHQQMTASRHYECSIEQADGRFDLEGGIGQGDAGDLFSATTKSTFGAATKPSSQWWDGSASGLEISAISAVGPVMNFAVGTLGEGSTIELVKTSTPGIAIPDNAPAGISDAVQVVSPAGQRVSGLTVAVDISHSYRGDLTLKLVAPSGAVAVLHNRTGAGSPDLKAIWTGADTPSLSALYGESAAGTWKLQVSDHAQIDVGRLNAWTLRVNVSSPPEAIGLVEVDGSAGQAIPDDDAAGLVAKASVTTTRKVAEVKLSTDITHSWIGDLVVSLISPTGTAVKLHDRAGRDADNLIRTFDATTTPALAVLVGQPAGGTWLLKVVDAAAKDTGKLNAWRLSITLRD